jgi:hypothetical protein
MEELKVLIEYYEKETGQRPKILGLALSSRKNLCINPSVSELSQYHVALSLLPVHVLVVDFECNQRILDSE